MVAGDRLVEGERLGFVARARRRLARVQVVAAGPAAVLGRLEVVGDRRVLRLVEPHLDDLAHRPGKRPEPGRDRRSGPVERRAGRVEDLVAAREVQARIGPEPGDRHSPVGGSDRARRRCLELRVDPLDLGQPDRVDRLGGQVERRMGPDEAAIGIGAAGYEREASPIVRSGVRQEPIDERLPIADEGRSDRVDDDGLQAPRRSDRAPRSTNPAAPRWPDRGAATIGSAA